MWAVVLIGNGDNSSAACDIFIVFNVARSCFGWLTCLRVIVWSGVCCASLILAPKYMSVCSLLTLCLTASGSYVKCACHKNTFHINLLSPLVETLAPMNHELSENESLFTQRSSVWKSVSTSFRVGRLFSMAEEKASCGQLSIVLASMLQRGLPGQIPSVMYSTIAAEQSRLSGVVGLWLYTGSFSSERVRGTGCTDNSHTENLISFSVTKSAKVYTSFFLYPALSLSGESSQRSRITERVCPCVITWFCNVTLQNCCGAGVCCAGLPGWKW